MPRMFRTPGRPGFRGFGDATASGGGVPAASGGNATQGKGIDFVYQTPTVASIAHGTSSGAQPIQFDNNSTFLWLRSTYSVDESAAAFTSGAYPVPLITVTIQDTGNGMQFMNAPIPVYSIAGRDATLPYILPTPQLVQPNASYSFNFANYDAAQLYTNLRFQMHGFRIFATDITTIQQAWSYLNSGS
jgi:hypothetical protein